MISVQISTEDPQLGYLICPHCGGLIDVKLTEIRCGIFRHAAMKDNSGPVDPHASQQVCEDLVAAGKIHGCGKPFQIDGQFKVSVCDYI